MSSFHVYANDYKVVCTNSVTLQIDASKIWQWCSRNMMKLNLAKCKLLSIAGEANIKLGERFLEKTRNRLGPLGLLSHLIFLGQYKQKTEPKKAIKSCWSIKRNISKASSWITKKNFYRSYVVPVIS